MKEAATIQFRDAESADEALVIVRHDETRITLAVSLRSNGDVQVVMDKRHAVELIEALRRAIASN